MTYLELFPECECGQQTDYLLQQTFDVAISRFFACLDCYKKEFEDMEDVKIICRRTER